MRLHQALGAVIGASLTNRRHRGRWQGHRRRGRRHRAGWDGRRWCHGWRRRDRRGRAPRRHHGRRGRGRGRREHGGFDGPDLAAAAHRAGDIALAAHHAFADLAVFGDGVHLAALQGVALKFRLRDGRARLALCLLARGAHVAQAVGARLGAAHGRAGGAFLLVAAVGRGLGRALGPRRQRERDGRGGQAVAGEGNVGKAHGGFSCAHPGQALVRSPMLGRAWPGACRRGPTRAPDKARHRS